MCRRLLQISVFSFGLPQRICVIVFPFTDLLDDLLGGRPRLTCLRSGSDWLSKTGGIGMAWVGSAVRVARLGSGSLSSPITNGAMAATPRSAPWPVSGRTPSRRALSEPAWGRASVPNEEQDTEMSQVRIPMGGPHGFAASAWSTTTMSRALAGWWAVVSTDLALRVWLGFALHLGILYDFAVTYFSMVMALFACLPPQWCHQFFNLVGYDPGASPEPDPDSRSGSGSGS